MDEDLDAPANISCIYKEEAPVVTHTVTFDYNYDNITTTATVNDGECVAEPDEPTREGFNFMGWKLNGADYDFEAPVTADITLVAEWEAIVVPPTVYTVTFMVDGQEYLTKEVTEGETVEQPDDPEAPEGQRFAYWGIDDGAKALKKYNFSTPVTSDLTLTAVFKEVLDTIDLSEIVIKKTIAGVDYDAITFTFNVEGIGTVTLDVPAYTETSPTEFEVPICDENPTYTAEGTYTYAITEVAGDADDWSYNTENKEYTLVVFVQEVNEGVFGPTAAFVVPAGTTPDNDGNYEGKCDPEFKNEYNVTTTQLTIENINVGPLVPADKEFTYTITFNAPSADGSKAPQYVTGPEGRINFGEAYTFTLINEATAEFTDIPVGTTFTLVETGVADHKHTVTDSNVTEIAGDGSITVNGPTNLEPPMGTLPDVEEYKVQVTNERVYEVASLKVEKKVEGEPLVDKTFSFKITFTAVDGLETILPMTGETEVGYSEYTFTLTDGDSIVFTNIPVGVTYVLTETGTTNYTAAYEASSGATGDADEGEDLTTESIEIVADPDENTVGNTITVTNTYNLTVPTGITIRGEMIGIMIVAIIALAGSFVLSRKLRRARN